MGIALITCLDLVGLHGDDQPLAAGQRELESLIADGSAVIQPFLASVLTVGERSLVFIAGRFSHAVCKRPAVGEFRVQAAWGGNTQVVEADHDDLRVADAALGAIGEAVFYARVDLLRDGEGSSWLLELELLDPRLYLSFSRSAQLALADAIEGCERRPPPARWPRA